MSPPPPVPDGLHVPRAPLVLRDTCLRCGGQLVPWHHWALCPDCESYFWEGEPTLPAPTLIDVGRPGWEGRT